MTQSRVSVSVLGTSIPRFLMSNNQIRDLEAMISTTRAALEKRKSRVKFLTDEKLQIV